jgi:hypothetical protein
MIIYFETKNLNAGSIPSPGKSFWIEIHFCEKSELLKLKNCGAKKIHRLNAQIYARDPPVCPSVSTQELLERMVIKSDVTDPHSRYV